MTLFISCIMEPLVLFHATYFLRLQITFNTFFGLKTLALGILATESV